MPSTSGPYSCRQMHETGNRDWRHMDKPKSNQDVTPVEERLGVLERRRIEAMVLGPLIRAYQDEIGQERAADIARRVITGIAREQGAAMAKKLGANGLRDFADNKEPWTRNGALEIDVIEKSDSEYSFNVTRCRTPRCTANLDSPTWATFFPAPAISNSPEASTPTSNSLAPRQS